jgi:biofilm PGA synthesis N-glycosyltransferase PgaC
LFILFKIGNNKAKNKNNQINTSRIESETISVIIPYRNESKNLPNLLASINELIKLPLEIIWIDDHSEDNSSEIIKEKTNPKFNNYFSLDETNFGKKNAIMKGIENSTGEYILTWDADITIKPNFFVQLESLEITDLTILPVSMFSKKNYTNFFENEFNFLKNINYSIYGWKRAIIANGANLLIKKNTFKEINPYQNNLSISSGDDQFLLKEFIIKKNNIKVYNNYELSVETFVPDTFKECLIQRIRWIGKTQKVNDKLANSIGIIGIIYHLFPYIMLIVNFKLFLITISAKAIFDFLIINDLKNRFRFTIIFSFYYPIYAILIYLLSDLINVKWKNRIVVK